MNQDRIINWEELPPSIRDQWHERAIGLSIPPLTFVGKRDNSSPRDRLAAINRDPALCAKVLAVANTSSFGIRSPIASIEQAVMQLGQNMLEVIVAAYQMEKVIGHYPEFSRAHFDFVRNWSALSAITAFHLAGHAGLENRGIISTASLLARVGSLVLGLTWPAPDRSYYEIADENLRYEHEMNKWGVSSPALGQQVARHWGLPEPLPTLIQRQEIPLYTELTTSEEDKNLLIMCVCSTIAVAYILHPESDPIEVLYEDHYFQLKQNLDNLGLADALRSAWDSNVEEMELLIVKATA